MGRTRSTGGPDSVSALRIRLNFDRRFATHGRFRTSSTRIRTNVAMSLTMIWAFRPHFAQVGPNVGCAQPKALASAQRPQESVQYRSSGRCRPAKHAFEVDRGGRERMKSVDRAVRSLVRKRALWASIWTMPSALLGVPIRSYEVVAEPRQVFSQQAARVAPDNVQVRALSVHVGTKFRTIPLSDLRALPCDPLVDVCTRRAAPHIARNRRLVGHRVRGAEGPVRRPQGS